LIKSIYRSDRAYTYVYGGDQQSGAGLAKPEKGGTVPRYFFNVVDGESRNLMRDSEGTMFPDLSGAREEAVGWARDFARHDFRQSTQSWQVIVTDEGGDVVLTVPLSEVRLRKMTRAWLELDRYIGKLNSRFGSLVLISLVTAAIVAVLVHAEREVASVTEMGDGYALTSTSTPEGVVVAVRFIPDASLMDITKFLSAYKASLVDGPGPSGFYKLRITNTTTMLHEETEVLLGRMTQEKVVEFAAVVQ
jgi:Domain of unknown function (DUF6894)